VVATGGGDDRAFIWKVSTGEKLFELSGHKDSVIAVAFSSTGKFLATGGMDGVVKVWESETGKLVVTLEGPDEVIVRRSINLQSALFSRPSCEFASCHELNFSFPVD